MNLVEGVESVVRTLATTEMNGTIHKTNMTKLLLFALFTSLVNSSSPYFLKDGCPERNQDVEDSCSRDWVMGMCPYCYTYCPSWTGNPSINPTASPTPGPTRGDSPSPTYITTIINKLTESPVTDIPTSAPIEEPSSFPSESPSESPSDVPSDTPSSYPTWIATSKTVRCPSAIKKNTTR
jgi:hypothetical protein